MLIKVHRVASVEEALRLEAAGADLIGVTLADDSHFGDGRRIEADLAGEIARRLARASLLVEPPWQSSLPELLACARTTGADWLQLPVFAAPPSGARIALAEAGVGLLVARVDADHDMDPNWVLGPVQDLGPPPPGLIELELLPSIRGSWRFLTETCPAEGEWLQVGDIERLAREAPLLLALDLTLENLPSVRAAIPGARGFALTLGTLAAGVSGVHVVGEDSALALVEAIARSRA